MSLRLALDSPFFCLCLPGAGVTNMHHHVHLYKGISKETAVVYQERSRGSRRRGRSFKLQAWELEAVFLECDAQRTEFCAGG